MTQQRSPQNLAKCPFHIEPGSPLSATESIDRCVACVTRRDQRLQCVKEDLRQIAYETVFKAAPMYDPAHESGASFITFIRSQVCGKLWDEGENYLESIPFLSLDDTSRAESQFYQGGPDPLGNNSLVDGLLADRCQCGGVDEEIIRHVEVEQFERLLPQLLACLSEKEKMVLELKFFEGKKGIEIAKVLGVTKGRVSQLINTACAKLKKGYLNASQRQRNS